MGSLPDPPRPSPHGLRGVWPHGNAACPGCSDRPTPAGVRGWVGFRTGIFCRLGCWAGAAAAIDALVPRPLPITPGLGQGLPPAIAPPMVVSFRLSVFLVDECGDRFHDGDFLSDPNCARLNLDPVLALVRARCVVFQVCERAAILQRVLSVAVLRLVFQPFLSSL